ncbi:acyltransferase [Bowmanella denitrificans]|uniref:acyltransferase n=1 Tax=Bowmanella denitrificans TaxID=366582 RepID=UPI000C9BBB0C|nr:acyltransferase [Bowmanella denitrificans]
MPMYQNIYLQDDANASATALSMGEQCYCSGEMDVTLTWVTDPSFSGTDIHADLFENCISIGKYCYLESLNRMAFQNGPVKLTSVKVNNGKPGRIKIGNQVGLQGTAIVAYELVEIEDRVTFGPGVTVMDSSGHPLTGRGLDDEAARIRAKPVLIKQDAWIGLGAVILKGVTIGRGAVIGAGAVVSSDIPDYCVAQGNPAKVVKQLDPLQHQSTKAEVLAGTV